MLEDDNYLLNKSIPSSPNFHIQVFMCNVYSIFHNALIFSSSTDITFPLLMSFLCLRITGDYAVNKVRQRAWRMHSSSLQHYANEYQYIKYVGGVSKKKVRFTPVCSIALNL